MKSGQTPIHIQRWAPADYHDDEHVKLLKARRDYRTLTFYRHFIDRAFGAGGDLPADPETLAAVVEMPRRDVEAALAFCLGRLIFQDGDRLYQGRVRRDVAHEMEFRAAQSERGKRGGRPPGVSQGKATVKPVVLQPKSPPSPSPTPEPFAAADAGKAFELPPPLEVWPNGNGGSDGDHPRVEATPAEARDLALQRLGPPPSYPQPPHIQAETSIRKERWRRERELLTAVGIIAQRTGREAGDVCEEVTAYERDGKRVRGKRNPAQISSDDRLERSLEDAQAWIVDLDAKKAKETPL